VLFTELCQVALGVVVDVSRKLPMVQLVGCCGFFAASGRGLAMFFCKILSEALVWNVVLQVLGVWSTLIDPLEDLAPFLLFWMDSFVLDDPMC
jgi:hypothetical protein